MKNIINQSGLSLIATVLALLIFTLFAAVIVSLVTTGSNIGVQEEQGQQAFYIAEGGVEFEQRSLAQNLDWYRSTSDPISTTARTLGAGSFSVSSNLPATLLRNRIPNATSINPIRVYTTNRFPVPPACNPCYLQVDDDITGSAEFIQYTGIVGDTFIVSVLANRNVTIGGVTGTAGSHARGSRVYPVTTLVNGLPNNCNPPASITIVANSKFLSAGTIDIEGEEISYTGSRTSGGNMILTGIQRCQNGTSSGNHGAGDPVTPILVDNPSPDFEAEIVSTGTVGNPLSGNIVRVIRKTVQR